MSGAPRIIPDEPTLEQTRQILYAPAAVTAAANLVASALADERTLVDELVHWDQQLGPLTPEERAPLIIGLLGSLTSIATVAILACARTRDEQPLDTLRYCENVIGDLRDHNETASR